MDRLHHRVHNDAWRRRRLPSSFSFLLLIAATTTITTCPHATRSDGITLTIVFGHNVNSVSEYSQKTGPIIRQPTIKLVKAVGISFGYCISTTYFCSDYRHSEYGVIFSLCVCVCERAFFHTVLLLSNEHNVFASADTVIFVLHFVQCLGKRYWTIFHGTWKIFQTDCDRIKAIYRIAMEWFHQKFRVTLCAV